MLRRSLFPAALCAVFFTLIFPASKVCAAALAQAASDSETFTLRGIVVNSVTGEPIRGALVQLMSTVQKTVLTGADGKYQIEGLPAGQAYATARKPGYFAEEELGQRGYEPQTVQIGAETPMQVIKLAPEGIIYGEISGEDGEPAEGLPVMLLARSAVNGKKIWQPTGGGRTNEDGKFRMAGLRPGTYYLMAGPSATATTFPLRSGQAGARGYSATFYGGASELSSATPIRISAGKREEIRISMEEKPFYRMVASVSGNAAGQGANVQFFDAAGQDRAVNYRLNPQTGRLLTPWMPAGVYTIVARSQETDGTQLFARAKVELSRELQSVQLNLTPSMSIDVHSHLSGTSRTNAEAADQNAAAVSVQLNSTESREMGGQMVVNGGVPGGQGQSMMIQNVEPGAYWVDFTTNGNSYVYSARYGSVDLLREPLRIDGGEGAKSMEIELRDDGATLKGRVTSNGEIAHGMVMAIREDAPSQMAGVEAQADGSFQFYALAPGTYRLFAVDRPDDFEYANAETVQKYGSKATEITLSASQSATAEVELIQVEE